MPTGQTLRGKIPDGQTPAQARDWVGKTFDLKAAYRQIPTSRDKVNSAFTVVGVYNPSAKKPAYFLQYATPFGAVSAVYLFNRAARAIHAIGLWVGFCWGNYFDDYPTLSHSKTATTTDLAIRSVCSLLGWTLSLEEKKNKPFAKKYNQLGLVANLERLVDGIAQYENKPERNDGIAELITQVIAAKRCPKPLMAEIRGKCQYASSQVSGRVAVVVLHELGDHQYRQKSDVTSDHTIDLLRHMMDILLNAAPRSISCFGETRPILVFTDAAAEGQDRSIVTAGVVIVDSALTENAASMWGGHVDAALVSVWKEAGNVQVIGQAELLPVLLVRHSNLERFRHRRVIFFIDNDSARQALTKGYSRAPASKAMLRCFVNLELKSQCWTWFSRVPTKSNPADDPSRLVLVPSVHNRFARVLDMPPIPEEIYRP